MIFYIPVFKDGSIGRIVDNEEDARKSLPESYYYNSAEVMKVLRFVATDRNAVVNFTHTGYFNFRKHPEKKLMVVPPLLDIRSNNKNFPPSRRLAHCAIKGLSPYASPFGDRWFAEEEF